MATDPDAELISHIEDRFGLRAEHVPNDYRWEVLLAHDGFEHAIHWRRVAGGGCAPMHPHGEAPIGAEHLGPSHLTHAHTQVHSPALELGGIRAAQHEREPPGADPGDGAIHPSFATSPWRGH